MVLMGRLGWGFRTIAEEVKDGHTNFFRGMKPKASCYEVKRCEDLRHWVYGGGGIQEGLRNDMAGISLCIIIPIMAVRYRRKDR